MELSLRQELVAEVDDVWSETVRHLPLADGRKDPERAAMEFIAVLRTGERDAQAMNFGRGSRPRARVAADGGTLRIDRAAYPTLLIRKGDKVVALGRDGQPVFDVLLVDDRSHLRLICELGDS